jgi:DNA-binding NarL/FixJ family response regulator
VGSLRDQLVEYANQASLKLDSVPKVAADPLSQREREVIALLACRNTNRQIAEELIISERTADGHVAHILAKLGL